MIWNQFGNVSVLEKSEISEKIIHGIIVGDPSFRFSRLDRKPKISSFIQIGPRMSEIFVPTPKMNAI